MAGSGAARRSQVRAGLGIAPLGRTQSERHRRLALAGGFSVAQIVWNRSTRRAGARGGARIGRPKWLRILTITGGSSMAAMIFKGHRRKPRCRASRRCRIGRRIESRARSHPEFTGRGEVEGTRTPEGTIFYGTWKQIRETFPDAELINATPILAEVRYVKSREEIDVLTKSMEIIELLYPSRNPCNQARRQGLGSLGFDAIRGDAPRFGNAGSLLLGFR